MPDLDVALAISRSPRSLWPNMASTRGGRRQSRSTDIHEATADKILKMTETMNDADRFLVTFAAFTGLRAGE
jgi:hypothetical protein